MALSCPKCAQVIPTEDINVATDVAMCRGCNTMHKASELVHDDVVDQTHQESADVLAGPQPRGVRWSDDGQTLTVRAGIGCKPLAGFFAVFALFWSLAALAMVGDLVGELINGPVTPAPIPEDASEFEKAKAEMEAAMHGRADAGDWAMAVVLTIIPAVFWLLAFTAMFASVRIRVRPDLGTVVKGSFPFLVTRHFDPARVTAVNETIDSTTRVNGRNPTKIVIKADEEIGFGGFMPEGRRKWVAAILRANLLRRR